MAEIEGRQHDSMTKARQMMGAVAQYGKSQIVLKLRGARMRKRTKRADARAGSPAASMKERLQCWNGREHFAPKAFVERFRGRGCPRSLQIPRRGRLIYRELLVATPFV